MARDVDHGIPVVQPCKVRRAPISSSTPGTATACDAQYDYASRHMDLGKLPVFLENQAKGNYKV